MKRFRLGGSVLALLLAACGTDAPREEAAATTRVDTVGGVEVVRSEGTPPGWSVEEIFTLGSVGDLGAAGPEVFGRISSVVADGEGNVYVADRQAREIRVFGPDGGYVRTLGREGRGPGEIGLLYSLAWLGDTLAVLDPRNARVGLFADGAWAGSWNWQPLTGDVRWARSGDGAAYVWVVRKLSGATERVYVRHTSAGPADTIPAPRLPEEMRSVVCNRPDGVMSFFDVPFAPKLVYAFAPGGELAVVPGGEYRIAFLDAAGDTVRVVERARPRVPVGDSEWEEGLRPYRELRERIPGARCEGEMARPAEKPAIRHLLFDGEGRMWVESITPEGFAWEVFDGQGRLLGSLPAPPRQERVPPYVRGNRLYLVDADSLDVQYVRAFQVGDGR